MRLVFVIGGACATTGMLLISMWLNYLFGSGLGQTPTRAIVFGCVSVIIDAWKGLGPIYILGLLRARRIPSATTAMIVWFVCFLYSVSSAIGIVIQDRATRTTGHDMARATYAELSSRFDDLQSKRKLLRQTRSSEEIDAALLAIFFRPIGDRNGRTVGTLSSNCGRVDARTSAPCAEVAVLRQELAVARETARLDAEISDLQNRVVAARDRGAALPSDPQGESFARLTKGMLSSADIGLALALLLASAIELISAFGPAVIAAFAHASQNSGEEGGTGKQRPVGRVLDYVADRVEPADRDERIESAELYTDYAQWCERSRRSAMSKSDFVGAFDRSRIEQGIRQIKKIGSSYHGIRLVKAIA